MFRFWLALSLIVAGTAQAAATDHKQARAYGLDLPAPDGFCELSAAYPADRDMLTTAEQLNAGHNRVLSIFADCGELDALRGKGVTLSNYAMYMMPMSAGEAPIMLSRAEVIELLANAFQETDPVGQARDTVRDRIAEADMAIELQELVGLGMLHRDDTALFTGVLTRTAADNGDVDVSAVITGMTLVGGRLVTLNLGAPYEGQQTIDGLLLRQRENLRQLIDAN